MSDLAILVGSQKDSIINEFQVVAGELNIQCCAEKKIEDLLLSMQEHDYSAVIIDLDIEGLEALKAIRLIKKLRPKVPLITIVTEIDRKLGGQIFDEGVFHVIMSPPSSENIRSALEIVVSNKSKITESRTNHKEV